MTETFQITAEQAERYESQFVPAIFGGWAPLLADVAGIRTGQRVLDVACGTGVFAREAARRLAGTGSVTGLDLNPAMLAVAARITPAVHWLQGDAEDLPFDDGEFGVVACQAALMFFGDPDRALREMRRVTAVSGAVAVQVFDTLAAQPAYSRLVEVVTRQAGPEAASLLGAYWVHGDLDLLVARLSAAGLRVTRSISRVGTARFASVDDVVRVEITASPLASRISDEAYARILVDARAALAPFTEAGGAARLPLAGHLVAAVPA